MRGGRQLAHGIAEAMDDDLRAQYRRLAEEMVLEAWRILRTGTPSARAQLIRTVVPAILRDVMQDRSEDSSLVEMRHRLDELHAEMRGGVGAGPAVEPAAVIIPEDTPG